LIAYIFDVKIYIDPIRRIVPRKNLGRKPWERQRFNFLYWIANEV